MRRRLLAALFLLANGVYPLARGPQVDPGTYITEGGQGNLVVRRSETSTLAFTISTVGANGHQCDLQGRIYGTKATLDTDEQSKSCIVTFTRK